MNGTFRNAKLAAFMSALIPGGGQIYVGRVGRGLALLFLGWILLITTALIPILVALIPISIFWVLNIRDAYGVCQNHNSELVSHGDYIETNLSEGLREVPVPTLIRRDSERYWS